MDKSDSHLFTSLMTFAFKIEDRLTPLIYQHKNEIYNKRGIDFESLHHFDSIGLIKFDDINEFALHNFPKKSKFFYFGKTVEIEFLEKKDNAFEVGIVMLTNTGRELAPICGASSHPDFLEYVFKIWEGKGYKYSLV